MDHPLHGRVLLRGDEIKALERIECRENHLVLNLLTQDAEGLRRRGTAEPWKAHQSRTGGLTRGSHPGERRVARHEEHESGRTPAERDPHETALGSLPRPLGVRRSQVQYPAAVRTQPRI